MPRQPRIQVEGGIYHLVSRGVRKLPLFTDHWDRERFLALFDLTLVRYEWELHTYCLMTNHFHLLVTTHQPTVSVGMQYLKGCYAQWFNWRHLFEGCVFDRRFHSKLVTSDEQLLTTARYILLNPVRAGLCASAGEWPWSSYHATVSEMTQARERFAAFVRAGEVDLRRGPRARR